MPDVIASKGERDKASEKTLEQAARVRTQAKAFRSQAVSSESWIEHRHELGRTRDAARAMVLLCAATGYTPLPAQEEIHLAVPPDGEDRVNKLYCGGRASRILGWRTRSRPR